MEFSKLLIIGIIVVFISCSDEDQEMGLTDVGTITAMDYRKCMCCGGWFIEINSETYRFNELPENSNLNLNNETLPIEVNLDWVVDENACLGDEIIVNRITKSILPG